MSNKQSQHIPFDVLPGHYIRRLQQISVAIFLQETEGFGITPVQFAALSALKEFPKIDQKTLANTIGLDTSTIGGVIDRLESRSLVKRNLSEKDRRVHVLTLTSEGKHLLEDINPQVLKAQQRILAPLKKSQHSEFIQMLDSLVNGNNDASRAPSIIK
jgi:DNA-binding MarR family transcriptional regulator